MIHVDKTYTCSTETSLYQSSYLGTAQRGHETRYYCESALLYELPVRNK